MATNQGSRAGLITSVVILSITSVVALIFAFWYGAEKRRADDQLTDLKKIYKDVVSDNALNAGSAEVKELDEARKDPASGFTQSTKLWDVALGQRNRLVKIVTGRDEGPDNTAASAIKSAETTLTAAAETVKNANASLPSTSDNLAGAISALADKVKVQSDTIADRDAKLKDATKLAEDTIAQKDADLKARDAEASKLREDATAAMTAATDDRGRQQSTIADIEKSREADRKATAEAMSKKDADLLTKNNEVKRLEDRLKAAQARFSRTRVGVVDPMIRHADGAISGFSGKDIVYINLGKGKQIVPGLTFEVYDKAHGLPQIKDAFGEDQPVGKATIEVLRVLDSVSEARVVRKDAGAQLMEGDPILNIVYDPNLKYNFLVYGKFDLDQNGVATEQDAQVIRRIIGQWGANLTNKIGVDTDFLVIGAEPKVPAFSNEELADPVNIKKQEDAKAELANYQAVLKEARELHIPILNQNRFLHLAGQADAVTH